MNCQHVQDSLPGFVYGDLPPDEKAKLENHLAGCSTCRHAHRALQEVRRLLERVPAPQPRVDLPRLYRQACELRLRQARRWRRLGVALAAAAAALVGVALGLRLEVRMQADQLVLRWNSPTVSKAATPLLPSPPEPGPAIASSSGATEEQVQL